MKNNNLIIFSVIVVLLAAVIIGLIIHFEKKSKSSDSSLDTPENYADDFDMPEEIGDNLSESESHDINEENLELDLPEKI